MERPAVVIDNGTGYTKMGYAGNAEPACIIPTVIAVGGGENKAGNLTQKGKIDDLDFFIGDEAISHAKTMTLNYPIRHGQVKHIEEERATRNKSLLFCLCRLRTGIIWKGSGSAVYLSIFDASQKSISFAWCV